MINSCEMLLFSEVSVSIASIEIQRMFAKDSNDVIFCDHLVMIEGKTEDSQKRCSKVYSWDAINVMNFDSSRKLLIVLHPSSEYGILIKFFECTTKLFLRMHYCIVKAVCKRSKDYANSRLRQYS